MPKETIEIDLKIKSDDSVAQVETKTKNIKTQLKEMKDLLASGTLDGKQFAKMKAEAGALQDKVDDVNREVKNLSSDTQKLDGIVSITQGIVGGFAAVQGITALVGDENKELQQTMMKLQGAMTAMMGIQQVANTLNKSSAATSLVQSARLKILTYLEKQRTIATTAGTGAMNKMRMAGQLLGIGLIITAIGLLITYFDDIKKAVLKFIPSMETLGNVFESVKNTVMDFLGLSSESTRAVEKNMEAFNKRKTQAERDIAVLEAIGGKEELIYRKKAALISNEILLLNQKSLAEGKLSAEDLKRKEDLLLEGQILDIDYNKNQEKIAADKLKKDNEAAQKRKDARKKRREDKKKEDDQEMADMMEALMNENAADDRQAEWEKKRAADKVKADEELAKLAAEKQAEQDEKDKALNEQKLKDQQDFEAAKMSIITDSFTAMNMLGELALGQQFKNTAAGKTIALAQIATDTALGFVRGMAIAQQSALGTGPAAAIAMPVFYASQVAAVLGAASKARGILGGGGGNVSAPSAGSPGNISSQPPSINTFRTNGGSRIDPVTKVVVLEKDITNAVDRIARIKSNATLI
jgi:hypothetical protein